MEHPADLADPGIHRDFRAAYAQRRFTAHRHAVGALATMQTPIVDIPHLVGIPAPEHLLYQAVIVASIVPRMRALEAVPVVSKNLFEEVPGRRSGCNHQTASLRSLGLWIVTLL